MAKKTPRSKKKPKETKWTDLEFVESLVTTMKKQEEEFPALKRVHARLDPQWQIVIDCIKKMMEATTEESIEQAAAEIRKYGEHAVYPLIDFVLSIKGAKKLSSV